MSFTPRTLILLPLALLLVAAPAQATLGSVESLGFHTNDAGASGEGFSATYSSILNGGVVGAGVALRNQGSGSITITLPAGATVEQAYLYWAHLSPTDPSGAAMFGGSPITGALIGGGPLVSDLCWGATHSWAWRADVTAMVPGSGTYTIEVPTGQTDGSDPNSFGSTSPMSEGASLLVVYKLASLDAREIVIVDGFAAMVGSPTSATFPRADPDVGTAGLIVLGADGQGFTPESMAFESSTFATNTWDGSDPNGFAPTFPFGNLWDTDLFAVPISASSAPVLDLASTSDCLGPVAFALDAPTPKVSPPTPELSTLLLAGAGLAATALVVMRRRN